MSSANAHSDELLLRMETLLRAWRPASLSAPPAHIDIPLLTEELAKGDELTAGDLPSIPVGVSTEVLQAHLAIAAERAMHELYKTLNAELNERLGEQLRTSLEAAIQQSIGRAVLGVHRHILVSVAESLTRSIEHTSRSDAMPAEPFPPLTRP